MERNFVQKIEPPTTAYQNRCTKISITSDHNHSPFNQAAITRTTTSLVAKRLHIQTVNLVGLEPPVVFRPNDFILETGQTAGNCAVQAPRESFKPCPRSTPLHGFPDAFTIEARLLPVQASRFASTCSSRGTRLDVDPGSRIVRGVERNAL